MSLSISKATLSKALAPLILGTITACAPINYSKTISAVIDGDLTVAASHALAQARGGTGGTNGSCCGGGNSGGNNPGNGNSGGNNNSGGGNSSNSSRDGSDIRYCTGTIEAVGILNGYQAYRFSEGKGNGKQNNSDGVFISSKTYPIGTTVQLRLNESKSALLKDNVWTNSSVRSHGCRLQLGEHWGKYQGHIGQGVPFQTNVRTTMPTNNQPTTIVTTRKRTSALAPANDFTKAVAPVQKPTITYSSIVVGHCVETTKSVDGVTTSRVKSCTP